MTLSVVCWLWGDKYTPEHVNRLRAMVRRNLALPHEFYCITDNPEGLDEFVRPVPIWDDFAAWQKHRRRLKIFAPEMRDIFGDRILQIDLDTVVVGDLTPLVDDSDFRVWKCPSVGKSGFAYNPSFMLMRTGARERVWNEFCAAPHQIAGAARATGWVGTDQGVIGYLLAPHERTWDEGDGLYAFRDHIRGNDGKRLPGNARLVGFYGPFDPADPALRERYPWLRTNWRSLRMDILEDLIRTRGWTAGAEVGVLRGDTFFHVLDRAPGLRMVGVDRWRFADEINADQPGHRSYRAYPLPEYRESVLQRAATYGERARVIEADTVGAAASVEDGSLDFAFIDADHTESAVRADIAAWLPKLKPTGWLMGHDYANAHFPGVKAAVDDILPGVREWPDYVWSIERSAIRC